MSDLWQTRRNPGVKFSVWLPGSLHLNASNPPACEHHNTTLEILYPSDLPDGFELKDGTELWACPWCYQSDGGIDTVALAESIVSEWNEYGGHFENKEPPEISTPGDGFVFD